MSERTDTELLRRAVVELRQLRARVAALERVEREPIAIVGIGCRFPGPDGGVTAGPDALWRLLEAGVDATGPLPGGRWDEAAFYDPDPAAPGRSYTRRGGFLPRVDGFDAAFFGIAPREARAMDPQQRLLLEVAWEALEHANLAPDRLYDTRVGVFVGLAGLDWATRLARHGGRDLDLYAGTGTAPSVAAGRVAHSLGFTGPAVAIDTACSSSLVAVHDACRALRHRDCDLALAGGVHLMLSPDSTIVLCKMGALSRDGRSKAFDQSADGFGRGEGCGVVVLRRLADAVAAGDPVIAVVRGSAVNHDGASGGLTVPNGPAQQAVVRRALEVAGVTPAEVDYVEAHGTGTPLGDPIELRALGSVFAPRPADRPLRVGSLKTNLGHLEAAAGVAGLIKVALGLERCALPPHLHLRRPSPHIPWRELPISVPTELLSWPRGERRRLAGVSAFGFSGTNAHVILEEAAPVVPGRDGDGEQHTLVLSARTETALVESARRLAADLDPGEALAPVAAAARLGRARLPHRLAIRAASTEELVAKLERFVAGDATVGATPPLAEDKEADGGPRHRRLPTYPFEHQRFWVEESPREPTPAAEPTAGQGLTYRLVWRRQDATKVHAASDAGRWWIVGGDEHDDHGDRLTTVLAARGATVERVPVERVTAGDATGTRPADLRGVVYLPGPLAAASVEDAASRLLDLLRGLDGTPDAHLWVVTRGAVAVGDEGIPAPAAAALWGLGRVAALEHPERWGGLVDLPAAGPIPEETLEALADELTSTAAGGEEVALRGDGRRVARLAALAIAAGGAPEIRPDGLYLVTGGTGRLGLEVARWLVAGGARHLAFVARRPPGEAAERAIAALRAAGASVTTTGLDVADEAALAELLDRLEAAGPALRGVVHAAGTTHVASLADTGAPELAAVLRPKVAGGWALHRATRERRLDFFVACSSIAGVWGSRGQGAYAAANAFLDALAAHRRGAGLPGLAVAWGLWENAGEDDVPGMGTAATRQWLARSGIRPLSPAAAVAALGSLLAGDATSAVVADVDWRRLRALFAVAGRGALFAEFPTGEMDAEEPSGGGALAREIAGCAPPRRRAALVAALGRETGRVLGFAPDAPPSPEVGFFDLGMDSLTAIELRDALAAGLGRELPASLVFDHPTIVALADHLAVELGITPAEPPAPAPRGTAPSEASSGTVAVVGVGCRLPGGADDPETLWRLLMDGVDTVAAVPAERWDAAALYDPTPATPGKTYVRGGAFLGGVERFDPQAFGISAREARAMDPQQRLLLEVVWEALERAGLPRRRLAGSRTAVFVGITTSDYAMLLAEDGDPAALDGYYGSGNTLNAAAGRVAYVFGLRGPALAIDTACSSSLVAVHLARRSLLAGECDLAIAAGVNLVLSPRGTIALSQARMLSPDGRSKAFSAAADGYGRGEGCAAVVLERLDDAEAADDPVLAVLLGSAVNQDGASGGFTVPNGAAQEELLRTALGDAGLAPAAVGYLEAHGTGTPLGDPIEVRAAAAALGGGRAADRPLLLGSLKGNFAHLESAAGVAGLVKAVLAVNRGELPPHLHGAPPSPHLPWGELPVRVVTAAQRWPDDGARRVAGVSSFGASGTNAHVLVAAPVAPSGSAPPTAGEPAAYVLPLSARSAEALGELVERFHAFLAAPDAPPLAAVCATVAHRRTAFEHRLALVATSPAEMVAALAAAGPRARRRPASPATGEVAGDGGDDVARLAELWESGVEVDWRAVVTARPWPATALPTYPFQRRSYWLPPRRATAAADASPTDELAAALTAVEWVELPREATAGTATTADAGRRPGGWLLLGDPSGAAGALAAALAAAGERAETVAEPLDRDRLRRWRGDLAAAGIEPRGVVHLRGVDGAVDADGDVAAASERLVGEALEVFQGLADGTAARTRLWIVTRGVAVMDTAAIGSATAGAPSATALAQSPLWGLGRVAALEDPGRWGGVLDLDPAESSTDGVAAVATELLRASVADGDDRVAWRGGRRWVPRLRPAAVAASGAASIRADASYLVAGGLGDLGLAVASRLADRGARHLVLLSRRGVATEAARRAVEELRARGVAVHVATADLADDDAVAAAFATARAAAPLAGVVHAAGVLDDALLDGLDRGRVAAVLAAKVAGAWNLHRATLDDRLDFFVAFSSVASLLGSPGQGAYAAANAFLDALAAHRRGAGLPALTVSWGPWAEVGMAARQLSHPSPGLRPIPPQAGLDLLERLLAAGTSGHVGAFVADWPALARRFGRRPPPFLVGLLPATADAVPEVEPGALLRELATVPEDLRPDRLRRRLREEVAAALGFVADELPEDRGFADLGMDSLILLTLTQRLQDLVGRPLPATLLFNHPSVEALATHLAPLLGVATAPPAAAWSEEEAMAIIARKVEAGLP